MGQKSADLKGEPRLKDTSIGEPARSLLPASEEVATQCETGDTARIGQLGQGTNEGDNGYYTPGNVGRTPLNFLVDCGSNVTLLSREVYQRIPVEQRPVLEPLSYRVMGVNDQPLETLGGGLMNITLQGVGFEQVVIVAAMATDGILGQDFLLKNRIKIDFGRHQISYRDQKIPCWTGGQANMVCQVEVSRETKIPPHSGSMVPVKIPQAGLLAPAGLVQMDRGLFAKKQVMCVSAVVDTRATNRLAIFNPTDEEITLYPEMNLGTCESTYPEEETEPDPRGSMRCART